MAQSFSRNFIIQWSALKLSGHNLVRMKEDLKNYISECTINQKIKWQRPANWEDMVEHHLYNVAPLSELSNDTLGPLPEEYINVGIRKIVSQSWVGIFGLSEVMEDPSSHPTCQRHLRVSAHHRGTQANSMAVRRMNEVLTHLRALVYEHRIKERWSHYLTLVKRIINYTIDG